ncbi:hypothetical protein ZYGR_0I03840 [Zygosaccharomyces rouxii]|uniref:ZYRO0C09174p n=2 Tax=Zygosaccharomyces rouxii TaxID=4956 RepID=C5DTK0_ZYGRC|nr:uncharacterized protein ZYRO0C09174g [Zygosaccharomyces rouxii]KAH9201710.1 impact [Zygosaccharomyces rouxii]GAV48087.1 hypothetical protein ZYGR_0I03840 [Zygosaccharomyces rouxii]CAR27111.1 ZYRO0C09174p [Zygosaccharomyces rouxii]
MIPVGRIRCLYSTMVKSWVESEILVDRKSKFQARCCTMKNSDEVPLLLQDLVDGNKSIAKASHPHMYAWRTGEAVASVDSDKTKGSGKKSKKNKDISSNSSQPSWKNVQQGCQDGGESGAGQRLLTLLERAQVFNVLVVVTRWYGGTPLGSARFRHITSTASECLKKSGFL